MGVWDKVIHLEASIRLIESSDCKYIGKKFLTPHFAIAHKFAKQKANEQTKLLEIYWKVSKWVGLVYLTLTPVARLKKARMCRSVVTVRKAYLLHIECIEIEAKKS